MGALGMRNSNEILHGDKTILKIVISPYLSLESSEYDEIWYAYAYFDRIVGNVRKIQKFPNSRWRMDAILKIIFWQ